MADDANNYGSLEAGAYGLQAAASLGSAYAQSEALKAQGSFQKTMAEINARMARRQAEDSIKRGEEAANQIRKTGKQVAGAQRASAAAQGLDVNEGSAADLLTDTEMAVTADIINVKNNAWREAWGLQVQATSTLFDAKVNQAAAKQAATQTLLTGGLNALESGTRGLAAFKGAKAKTTTKPETKEESGTVNQDPYFGTAPRYEPSVSGGDLRWWGKKWGE